MKNENKTEKETTKRLKKIKLEKREKKVKNEKQNEKHKMRSKI